MRFNRKYGKRFMYDVITQMEVKTDLKAVGKIIEKFNKLHGLC